MAAKSSRCSQLTTWPTMIRLALTQDQAPNDRMTGYAHIPHYMGYLVVVLGKPMV